MNSIYRRHRGHVAFYVVYIREIHPSDGWQVVGNEEDGVIVRQPGSLAERIEVGKSCMLKLSLELPALVDEMDDAVATEYAAMPERLYVVGSDGRIAYKGGIGPVFFDPAEWEAAIARCAE